MHIDVKRVDELSNKIMDTIIEARESDSVAMNTITDLLGFYAAKLIDKGYDKEDVIEVMTRDFDKLIDCQVKLLQIRRELNEATDRPMSRILN